MTFPRCKTCIYWGVYTHSKDGRSDKDCDRVNIMQSEMPPVEMYLEVWADDDQGLGCELRTGPEFGCVHHKDKKE